jgi:hypothetical protein
MRKFYHRRQGAPFALIKEQALPATVVTDFGDVTTEIAPVGDAVTAVSGSNPNLTPLEPVAAKQVLRWHFLNNQTGNNSANRIEDYGPDGAHGRTAQLNSITTAINSYATHDGTETGAYGMFLGWASSVGGDGYQNRICTDTGIQLSKLASGSKFRFIMGVQPFQWYDRAEGMLLEVSTAISVSAGFSILRMPDGSLRVRYASTNTDFPNFFTTDLMTIIEVEFDGNIIRVFRDFQFIGEVARNSGPSFTTPVLWVGNQRAAGRGVNCYYAYVGVYAGEMSERELAWARAEAKTQIEGRPGGRNAMAVVPSARPNSALRFTALPNTIPETFQTVGNNIRILSGRAVDGLNGPIDFKTRMLFGPLPEQGAVQNIEGLNFLPSVAGYLTIEQTADNGVHPPLVVTKVLPVAQSFPVLNAATIETRLGSVVNHIDNADAGFPPDMVWRAEMVCDPGDGTVGLRILRNTLPGRKYQGASIQFRLNSGSGAGQVSSAQLFDAAWTMQLIDTRGVGQAKGYIQTGFTFTVPWSAPRRELDFEFNSQTGYMECSIHLASNEAGGPGSVAQSMYILPPAEAFTSMRTWRIVSNSDRFEWYYEDQVCARYIRGAGWDRSVQTFSPVIPGTLAPYLPDSTPVLHPRDEHWHLNAQNVFIQHWMSDTLTGWIGPNTVPIDHPLLRFSAVVSQEFGPANTALLDADWTATAGSAGEVVVNVSNYRPIRFRPSHLEYSIDGGAWVRLPGTTGNQTISGLASGSRAVRLRPVAESLATNPLVTASNYTLNADPSDTKNVTVS